MPKGFAHPYLMLAVLVFLGAGATLLTTSPTVRGFVLGTQTHKENVYRNQESVKVTIVSPHSSWDLVEYLCNSRDECEKSVSAGRWWATVSGGPTLPSGYEASLERSSGWGEYKYLKVAAKTAGANSTYLKTADTGVSYYLVDLSAPIRDVPVVKFSD